MSDKLYEELMKVVNDGTFTQAALSKMNAAIEKAKVLENNLMMTNERLVEAYKEVENTKQELNKYVNREGKIVTREDAVSKREAAITELEKKTAVAEARESVRKEMFDTIFRNSVVRKTFNKSIPVPPGQGGYPTTMLETGDTFEEEQ